MDRMARRAICAALAVAALGLAGAALAWACTPNSYVTFTGPDSGPPGTQTTLNGQYFSAGAAVEIRGGSESGPLLATATGPSFNVGLTIPDVPPGVYYIVATARNSSGQVEGQAMAPFAVTGEPAAPTDESPNRERGPLTGFFGSATPRPSGVSPSSAFAGCAASAANVIRDAAADSTIVGTPAGDRIFAGAGNDVIRALRGDDCVDLGPGADRARGGAGRDLVLGRSGGDRIRGGPGRDRLSGGPGRDRIAAGDGARDRIRCGGGFDRVAADAIDRVGRSCERVRLVPGD